MILSTARGRGWSNQGIGRYNELITVVMMDRINHKDSFDQEFRQHCQEKLAKMNSMKTRKKLKSEIEFGPKTRGLSQRQLEAMLRSIVANERR